MRITRDDFMEAQIEELFAKPAMGSFIKLVVQNPEKNFELYQIYFENNQVIGEKWYWDRNKDFSQLTRKANLEALNQGNYESSVQKMKTTIENNALQGLIKRGKEINLDFGDFEFENRFMMYDGPIYWLELVDIGASLKVQWTRINRNWIGVREFCEEMVYLLK